MTGRRRSGRFRPDGGPRRARDWGPPRIPRLGRRRRPAAGVDRRDSHRGVSGPRLVETPLLKIRRGVSAQANRTVMDEPLDIPTRQTWVRSIGSRAPTSSMTATRKPTSSEYLSPLRSLGDAAARARHVRDAAGVNELVPSALLGGCGRVERLDRTWMAGCRKGARLPQRAREHGASEGLVPPNRSTIARWPRSAA
jgi:hypothetical protein